MTLTFDFQPLRMKLSTTKNESKAQLYNILFTVVFSNPEALLPAYDVV